jgi:hypothetical protein
MAEGTGLSRDTSEGGRVDWLLEAVSGSRREPARVALSRWATAEVCEVMYPQLCGDFAQALATGGEESAE